MLGNFCKQGRKSRCSCRIRLKFDSVAKLAECPDHPGSAGSSGVFRNRRAPFLIANAFIQNHPDQLIDAMRNCPDGFVVAEARNETTVDDLEDASFMLSCSIGSTLPHSVCAAVKRLQKLRLRRLFRDERFFFRTDSNERQRTGTRILPAKRKSKRTATTQ